MWKRGFSILDYLPSFSTSLHCNYQDIFLFCFLEVRIVVSVILWVQYYFLLISSTFVFVLDSFQLWYYASWSFTLHGFWSTGLVPWPVGFTDTLKALNWDIIGFQKRYSKAKIQIFNFWQNADTKDNSVCLSFSLFLSFTLQLVY